MKLTEFDCLSWKVNTNTMQGTVDFIDCDSGIPDIIDYDYTNRFSGNCEEPLVVNIELYAEKGDNKQIVARVELFLTNALEDDFTIYSIMDGYSTDSGQNKISDLLQSKEFANVKKNYSGFKKLFVGVLQELYVYPEFRRCSISKWINNNLNAMLCTALDINIGCLTTYIRPYRDGCYGEYIDGETKMTRLMYRVFRKNGWRKIKDNIYIRSFADTIHDDE